MDEQINWREHARQLALALGYHRTDMHQASRRPCETCQFSRDVLYRYLDDVKRERTQSEGAPR